MSFQRPYAGSLRRAPRQPHADCVPSSSCVSSPSRHRLPTSPSSSRDAPRAFGFAPSIARRRWHRDARDVRAVRERPPRLQPSRRRVTLGAAAFAALAYSPAGSSPAAAAMDPLQTLTRRGMAKFARNDVEGSVEDFDLLISSAPSRAPYMWQRGLSLYYLERYADGAAQFRRDVAVNPNDTEEAVWAFLCEARDPSAGFDAARANLLEVGRDPRGYMREAYALFAGDGSEAALRATADGGGAAGGFLPWLYVGLFREARGDAEGAREAMLAAVDTPYGRKSGDYMAALAEVHLKRRGWA